MRVCLLLCLLLGACSGGGVRRPADKNVNLVGTVYLGGVERRGDPLEGASITVSRGSDGSQLATALSSSTGGWRLAFAAEADTRVVVAFRAPNLVPNFRALSVGPFAEAQLSVALEPPEPIECTDNQCIGGAGDLSLSEVADGLIGRARVFEPSTETPRLAGLGSVRPLVVAWFQLDAGPAPDAGADDAGVEFDGGTFVPGPPVLRVRVPFVAWRGLEDARPGTASVEVPLLAFDEAKGSWSKQVEGVLQTELGVNIPESALAKIREGQFAGGVVAVATITRAGYWTIALPAASPGCLTGKVEADGQSAEGALVSLEGTEPATARADGTICFPAALSASGPLAIQYAGFGYRGEPIGAPAAAGVCGGSCTAVGTIPVQSSALTAANLCKLTGKTVDGAGTAVTGAVVLGFDESLGGNAFSTLCGKLRTRCILSTSSNQQGEFTLEVPLLSGIAVTASALVERTGLIEGSRRGTLLLRECPAGPVQLRMLAGHDKLDLAVTLTGAAIGWTPARPAASVRVIDALGAVKWELQSSVGINAPLTYGVLPAGAVQLSPASGAPPALVAGDEVSVLLDGTGGDGYQYSGGAAAIVP